MILLRVFLLLWYERIRNLSTSITSVGLRFYNDAFIDLLVGTTGMYLW